MNISLATEDRFPLLLLLPPGMGILPLVTVSTDLLLEPIISNHMLCFTYLYICLTVSTSFGQAIDDEKCLLISKTYKHAQFTAEFILRVLHRCSPVVLTVARGGATEEKGIPPVKQGFPF